MPCMPTSPHVTRVVTMTQGVRWGANRILVTTEGYLSSLHTQGRVSGVCSRFPRVVMWFHAS
jgi:hypothetical protein